MFGLAHTLVTESEISMLDREVPQTVHRLHATCPLKNSLVSMLLDSVMTPDAVALFEDRHTCWLMFSSASLVQGDHTALAFAILSDFKKSPFRGPVNVEVSDAWPNHIPR